MTIPVVSAGVPRTEGLSPRADVERGASSEPTGSTAASPATTGPTAQPPRKGPLMTFTTLHAVPGGTDRPEHQPREHPVPCLRRCGRTTWNVNAICDSCTVREQTNTGNIVEQAHYVMPARCHGCGTWTLGPAFCTECSAVTARAFQPAGTGRAA